MTLDAWRGCSCAFGHSPHMHVCPTRCAGAGQQDCADAMGALRRIVEQLYLSDITLPRLWLLCCPSTASLCVGQVCSCCYIYQGIHLFKGRIGYDWATWHLSCLGDTLLCRTPSCVSKCNMPVCCHARYFKLFQQRRSTLMV
eukprot:366026-Chlamydomonas_euryale.AAC.12